MGQQCLEKNQRKVHQAAARLLVVEKLDWLAHWLALLQRGSPKLVTVTTSQTRMIGK